MCERTSSITIYIMHCRAMGAAVRMRALRVRGRSTHTRVQRKPADDGQRRRGGAACPRRARGLRGRREVGRPPRCLVRASARPCVQHGYMHARRPSSEPHCRRGPRCQPCHMADPPCCCHALGRRDALAGPGCGAGLQWVRRYHACAGELPSRAELDALDAIVIPGSHHSAVPSDGGLY